MKISRLLSASLGVALIICLSSCILEDDNAKPFFNKENGLAINCRAYVQVVIDGYRSRQYTAIESIDNLERNCGNNGISWKDNR